MKDCPHCMRFDPDWEELINYVKCEEPCSVKFEKIEGPAFKQLTDVYKVYAFPTLVCTIREKDGEKVLKYEGSKNSRSYICLVERTRITPIHPKQQTIPTFTTNISIW